MCMASGTTLTARSALYPECRMTGISSSMYQSTFPCLRGFTDTSAGKAVAKGMLSSKMFGLGFVRGVDCVFWMGSSQRWRECCWTGR